MDKDIYLHVSSSDSSQYFSPNNAGHFCLKLNTPLDLNGSWVIGVCEVDMQNIDVSANTGRGFSCVAIECNICTGLIVNGVQRRVLRVMPLKTDVAEVYPIVFYVPIETRFIDTIEFRVTNGACEEASFALEVRGEQEVDAGHISMTLHIKRLHQT
jgi:hypothetical protein